MHEVEQFPLVALTEARVPSEYRRRVLALAVDTDVDHVLLVDLEPRTAVGMDLVLMTSRRCGLSSGVAPK